LAPGSPLQFPLAHSLASVHEMLLPFFAVQAPAPVQ
jgi:hypothetical protein